ncbi:hypothetical protein HD597_005479 [Nonomuraea thailandensis]|uniref:Uncharacterized protein n=1 Tax=Nonomuraea thailandensis TaxID=1188745 RepID=A0A9X2GJ13_9ACTN|nr:hypothetical protein [Nonomuraea thailandensis]MCP2358459.1 hypothetical protein [Nonomuraea thailandensis]
MALGHEERLGDVIAGNGADVDLQVICAWSWRGLPAIHWLVEPAGTRPLPGCEVDVLRSRM